MTRDPAAMTPDDRLGEIASILALGYRRLLQKRLDDQPGLLALCAQPVNATATEASS